MLDNLLSLPRTILVTSNEEKISYNWDKSSHAISKDTLVATIEDLSQNNIIILPKHIHEGDVLIAHPFEDGMYVNISRAVELENSKFNRFAEIAQLLGANEYHITAATKKTYTKKLTVDGDVKYSDVCTTKLDFNKEDIFKEEMGFQLKSIFDGFHKANEDDYALVLANVRQYNLEEEDSLRSLIRMRNPQIANAQTEFDVICNVTQELNENLDAALSLTACKAFNLKASVKQILESRTEKRVEIHYSFPK